MKGKSRAKLNSISLSLPLSFPLSLQGKSLILTEKWQLNILAQGKATAHHNHTVTVQ